MRKTYRKPHRYKRKKSIFRNRFFWLGVLISVFIISLFYFLFFSETFQVEKIIITGEKKVSEEDIKLFVEKKLENRILFFKTKSIFSVDLDKIEEDIFNNFPQIAEIRIKRGFPDALNVIVMEKLGIAIWCQNEQCFLLDNEGVIFDPIRNDISNGARKTKLLIKIKDKRNIASFGLREEVIKKEELSQILEIGTKLKLNLKIPLKEFIIVSEDKLIVITDEGWEIYLNLRGNIEWQLTKLSAVLEEKIPKDQRKDLEYIELRFGNFAPYKYRD